MKRKHQRMIVLGLAFLSLCGAVTVLLTSLQQNLVFFYSPSELKEESTPRREYIRIGGMVVKGSLEHLGEARVRFVLTDFKETVTVDFTGFLPALFREGQGIIAEGHLDEGGVFQADSLLAKHDENYMPPELKRQL